MCNDEFQLPDRLYTVSHIQDYFQYIIQKQDVNPPIRIYVNEIENRITFKIKTGYCLEILKSEMMKLLGSFE